MTYHDGTDDCAGCPLERRDFLKDAITRVLVAVGAVSALSARAGALPITFVSGLGGRAEKAYPLPASDGVAIDREESVVIARFDNKVYAFSQACPHQNTAIRWEAADHRFQCPKHKSRYRPDGTFIEGRATRGLDRFALRADGDKLMVNLDALYREDENHAEWSSAFLDLSQREK